MQKSLIDARRQRNDRGAPVDGDWLYECDCIGLRKCAENSALTGTIANSSVVTAREEYNPLL
jgi:hypothetical protein